MAVEYIDSPNAGFIKLGEGVGLETITPQRKRKIKRGDRGIFPITPTGAESYEGPDFKAQEAFSTPASAIPNVFDRYRTLPGGARAGGFPGGSFEDVISPGIGNQNDDANDDDDDLEEELRRQSLDIDPVGDYDLSRFDPNSPNFNPTAAGEQAYADVLTGGDFFSSLDRFGVDQFSGEAATISFNALGKANSDIERAQNLVNKTKAGTRIGDFALNALESATQAQKNLQTINDVIGKRGAAPSGNIPTTVPEQSKDYRGLTALDRALLGGTGIPTPIFNPFELPGARSSASTEIPKVGFDRTGGINQSIFNTTPSGVADPFNRNAAEFQAQPSTPAPAPAASDGFEGDFAPDTPTPSAGSVEGDLSLSGIDVDITPEPPGLSTDFEGGGDQAALDAFFSGSFGNLGAKDGGKISFMNIKK